LLQTPEFFKGATADGGENVTESANLQNDVPLETSIPASGVPLESILCTEELHRRPRRPPDHEKENRALVALASALAADSSHTILQTLAETILQVTESDSSGLSLLTTDDGGKRFYWPAIAGMWKPHAGGGTPRNFGPCGDVLDRNCTLLFKHFERRYPYLLPVIPTAEECLLLPFYVGAKAVGTIWAIMHSGRRRFDVEDERIMNVLGQFASLAYQTLASIDDLKSQMAARERAETELRELTNGLDSQVRARTEELEQRNKQLAEARARLAEEKLSLERSEAYLAEAQRLSHTGSWHLNVSTGEVVWSNEFFAIFGFNPDKTKPSFSLNLERIHPEDRDRVEQIRSVAIRDKRNFEVEYRILLPGGSVKYVHSVAHCCVNQSGDIEYIGTVMDITERKQAGEKLRLSEASLAEAQHLSSTGSFAWRLLTTDEITWSEELYRIFELDPATPITLERIRSLVHPEDVKLLDKTIDGARSNGDDFECQYRFLTPDHSVKYLHVVARATRDQDGQLEYIGAVQDVTARRLSEEALDKAGSELVHVARVMSLGTLTASIAHELNQPLSGIITNASTCLRMLAADPPNVDGARETAQRTIRDGNRASEVITRLRALFGKKEARSESVDLNEATREVVALSSSELQRNRVILQTELADDLPLVTGDRVQLQQVILNLLRNASDAMSAVDDRPRQLLIRTERPEGDRVSLTVQDAGVGFEPQVVDKLFEAFYTTKNVGMGIGLSVSRSIIESHHGRLWAMLNDGPGATFSFSIPYGPEGVTGAHSLGANRTPAATNARHVMRNP
jgi:PAS domain S-box-containing protein